jgi:acyl-CoA dehydrogenase
MAVTDPDAEPHKRMSMFIVPADAEGLNIERNFRFYGEREDVHGYMHWRNVRVGDYC